MRVSSMSIAAANPWSQCRREVGEVEHISRGSPIARQERACQQFVERERLDEIVVGACVEPGHAVG